MPHRVLSDPPVQVHILGPFLGAIAVLAALCAIGFQMLSAARAFVGGESLWSKARSEAVASLRDYAVSRSTADRRRFLEALAVPLGDRRARLALDSVPLDIDAARAGFLAGGNDAADVDGMIRLYRYFGRTPFLRESVAAWKEGDIVIDGLQGLGERLRDRIEAGDDAAALAPLRAELDRLDGRVTLIEKRFSMALGEASRRTELLLTASVLLLALLLALASTLFVRRVLRHQLEGRRLLAEANERWELAGDAAGIGVFEWDSRDDSSALDAQARRLLGVAEPAGRVPRAVLREHVLEADREALQSALADCLRQRECRVQLRFRVALPEVADVRHIELAGLGHEVGQPARQRMVGIVRDVTESVTQARLTLEKEAAERVARLRMEFLSRLSHELRTPLNAVLGLAQLLAMDRKEPLGAEQSRRVAIILDSGQHLLRLVDDVLDISRIDAGTLALQTQSVDLRAAIEASLNLVESERTACDVRVETRLPAGPLVVQGDRQRLQQVLANLFSNGCKYNRRGGRLSIEASVGEGAVRIVVADEGRGMDAGQLAQLFQPFQRFDARSEVAGTGLGLVIVKLLVELMRGRIDVTSTPGLGSRFELVLPQADRS